MTLVQNRSAKNLINVRASMSRRKTLATLRKARLALAAKRSEQLAARAVRLATLERARATLAWQRHMGIVA